MATVIIVADGGITTSDHFTFNLGRDSYVLSDGQTKNILRARELEAIPMNVEQANHMKRRHKHSGIGRDDDFLLKGILLPCIGVQGFSTAYERDRI